MAKRWVFGALHEADAKESLFHGRVVQIAFKQDRGTWQLEARGWLSTHLRHLLETQNRAGSLPQPRFAELNDHMQLLGASYARYGVAGREVIEAQGRSAVALWEWLYRYLGVADADVPLRSAAE